MYYKRRIGTVLLQKSRCDPQWVKWVHRSLSDRHCQQCLKLDGCLFARSNHPRWPHHPSCHCILESVDYATVLAAAVTHSDYRKFDPYLFNTDGMRTHNKEKLFQQWGYTVEDARWLQQEVERQALEKYVAGDYKLGKLNENGQRISIQIAIPRKDIAGSATFTSGWMVEPNGKLKLNTPYGGK